MVAVTRDTIIIFTGGNDQLIQLTGLVDQTGSAVTGATITASLSRSGVALANSTMTFTDVVGQAGNYTGTLSGFNASAGPAILQVSGNHNGVNFGFQANVSITARFV